MRILCLPYTHTFSHLSRPLAVAEELRAQGHEVMFAGGSPKVNLIAAQNFEVLPVVEPDPDKLFGNIRNGKMRFVSDAELQQLVEADLELFRQAKPDVLLTDGRFSAAISAQIAGIRHAALVNVSSTQYRALPYVPFFSWIPAPDGSAARGILDRLNLRLEMAVFDKAMQVFTRLCRKHGLRHTVTATNCLAGADMTLLADVPEYFPTRNLPDNYTYVGPLTWKAPAPLPDWWPPMDDGRPLVYLTMGTTGTPDLFRAVHKAVTALPYRVVATTGGQLEGFPPADNFYNTEFMDGELVLSHSAAVICHGGNGTIYQALGQATPILGMPTIPDQSFNMRRVSDLGLGITLAPQRVTRQPEQIGQALRELLENPAYRQACQRFQTVLAGYDAPKQSAEALLRLANQ